MPVLVEESLCIPAEAHCLEGFRRWAQTDDFPKHGRIDFLNGDIEVNMSPEDLYTHGTLKSEITTAFQILVAHEDAGCVFTDRTRVSHPEAGLSAEPDVVVVMHAINDAYLRANRVRGGIESYALSTELILAYAKARDLTLPAAPDAP